MTANFLPFLPQDVADSAQSDESVRCILKDVQQLLALDAAAFWEVVRTDGSLGPMLDSFLRFCRRPFDDQRGIPTQQSQELYRSMLLLLIRLVFASEAGTPAEAQRRSMLTTQNLLTVTVLLDVAAVYSIDNPRSVADIVQSMLRLHPTLVEQLRCTADDIAQNVTEVAAAFGAAASSDLDAAKLTALSDGLLYLRDACLTLCALLRACPAVAAALVHAGARLVEALATVLGTLPSSLRRALSRSQGAVAAVPVVAAQVQHHVGHLEVAGERAVYLLLLHAYLDPDAFIQSSSLKLNDAQPNAAKKAQGATDPSRQPRGGTASASLMTPEARGMAFMDTASHLGQQVEAQPAPATLAKPASVNLGRVLCDKFALDRDVRAACSVGFIALDAAQGDYLAAMLGAEEPFGVSARRDVSGAGPLAGLDLQNELWPSLNGDAGAAGQADASKISAVRDVLPDYGEGFVAACLNAYGNDSERVLHALLEGPLTPELAALDPQLPLQPSHPAAPAPSWRQLAADACTSESSACNARPPATGASGSSDAPSRRVDAGIASFLDTRGTFREAVATAAASAQWEVDEYDDEYDDSFEEPVTLGADGSTEAEDAGNRRSAGEAGEPFQSGQSLAPGLSRRMGATSVSSKHFQRQFKSADGPAQQLQRAPQSQQAQQQRPPQQQHAQQQRQQQPGRPEQQPKQGRMWVLDGKVYNYKKDDRAVEVSGQAAADAAVQVAVQEAQAIHGLGRGGNVPYQAVHREVNRGQGPQREGARGADGPPDCGRGAGPPPGGQGAAGGGGRGRGGGPDGRGPGAGPGGSSSFAHKDKNKAAVGNHHRKDRATKKMSSGMF